MFGLQNKANSHIGRLEGEPSSDGERIVAYGIVCTLEALTEGLAEVRPFRDEAEARPWLESW